MKTKEEESKWTKYNLSKREFIEKLGLAPDTDYISVFCGVFGVEITTTRKGQ